MSTNNLIAPPRRGVLRRLGVVGSVIAMALGLVVLGDVTPAAALPRVGTVSVGTQATSLNAGTAGATTYLVTVLRGNTSSLTANLTVSGLPAGVTGTFVPTSVSWVFGGAITDSRTATLTVVTTAATPGGVSPFTVTAVRSTFGSTDSATGTGALVVTSPQTITFDPLLDRAMGDAPFDLTATASSGLPVTYTAADGCTVVGSTVTLAAVGSCTITASQPGDAAFLPAAPVSQTFAIAQGSQSITFNPLANKTIYDSDFSVSATASSGLAVTFGADGECTVVGDLVHLSGNAGSCTITASQAGDPNYSAASDVSQSFDVAFIEAQHLWAEAGTTTLAGTSVPVWGYNSSDAAVAAPGGRTLVVTQGDPVAIVLHNRLAETTSLVVRGQSMTSDLTGVAAGANKVYTFTPTEPGTFIYEAGPLPVEHGTQHQVAMGLYGALVVLPASGPPYGSNSEAVVLASEIDPALNNSATPATFDMRNFAPKYTLFNGKVYPSTPVLTNAVANSKVLLRYVNAGISYHSLSVLGGNQTIVADDGHTLGQPYTVVAQTVGPGQTTDAILRVPAGATPGTLLSVFDANLQLRNKGRKPALLTSRPTAGGAVGFVQVGGTPVPGDTAGPVASNLVFDPDTNKLTAKISDTATGNSNVAAAEYFVDTVGAVGSGATMSGTFGSPTADVSATLADALTPGTHTLYVRGRDDAPTTGNWGLLASIQVSTDNQPPVVSGLSLTPTPTNGTVDVALHATASDVGTGGSNIVSAEYSVGAITASMVVSPEATTASLDVSIPASVVNGLASGDNTVTITATDAADNTSVAASIVLKIDKTGPSTSSLSASPNPTNGKIGVNSSTSAVRVSGSSTDVDSKLIRAEGFIGLAPDVDAYGTGFLFVPSDGTWSSTTEAIHVDIPLSTIVTLPNGPNTIHVHTKDAAGNWGPFSTVTLNVDKIPPTLGGIALVGPASLTGATSVQFTVSFSENVTGLASGNFTLVQGGGLTGAAITSITGSGTTWTVTASTGSGGGTLGLNLTSTTGIVDQAGNVLTAIVPVVGPVYTLLTPPLYFSTFGNSNPPGVGGTADDADIYWWNGTAFSRSIDVSGAPYNLPAAGFGNANVDGFDRVDATHFYLSFNGNVTIPIPGPDLAVQDEDVVYYNNGVWSLWFDGSVRLVGSTDLDAISIVGTTLYFSTDNTAVPNGVIGGGDDADIYRWNGGSSYTRMIDASAVGWSSANVDGVVWVDSTHLYLSYSSDTTVAGPGAVQDEDVVYLDGTTWSVYFDGTAKSLTSGDLDVDAFDLP